MKAKKLGLLYTNTYLQKFLLNLRNLLFETERMQIDTVSTLVNKTQSSQMLITIIFVMSAIFVSVFIVNER